MNKGLMSDELTDQQETRPATPKVSLFVEDDGSHMLSIGDNTAREVATLKAALGLTQPDTLEATLSQVINSTMDRTGPVEKNYRYALGFIQSIEPENEVESALATQMAATHIASMEASRRFMQASTLQQQEAAERAMNKLMRTFTTQMETLKRYRSQAQQIVRVERVTVEDGGQAIVGPVTHEGGQNER